MITNIDYNRFYKIVWKNKADELEDNLFIGGREVVYVAGGHSNPGINPPSWSTAEILDHTQTEVWEQSKWNQLSEHQGVLFAPH